jgi:purine-nucleoside phosphorylase
MSLEALQAARAETAVILGSGLGSVVDAFELEAEVPYAEVPGLSASTVPGHAGRLVLVRDAAGRRLLFAQGRRHLYEGLSAAEVATGVRVLHGLGVRRLVLTNAAGCLNPAFAVGDLMLILDHLNLLGDSPLRGGPHFHDMSEVYDATWRTVFREAAGQLGQNLREGVYAAVQGPQYETPAEVRMLSRLGADAVGMSTVPEAIQARALGMQVAGVSMLTNWAAGLAPGKLHHDEVVATGRAASTRLAALLQAAL